MRSSGTVRDARDPGRHDHVCLSYEDVDDFLARARDYLAEGLALGQRVRYVATGAPDDLVSALRGLDGLAEALDRGALEVASVDATYVRDEVVEPAVQVRAYAAATEEALAAGYTGFRVAAEATTLVRTSAQLAAFLRYEHLVDRYMAEHPFSAMCGYDATRLDKAAVDQLAGVHPRTNRPGPFRLHAARQPARGVELGGEVDASGHDLLATLLDLVDLQPSGGELVVHAPDLEFIDHRGLMLLADAARRRSAPLVLRTRRSGPARLAALLDIPDTRVEQIP